MNRAIVVGVAAVLVAAAAGLGLWTWSQRNPPQLPPPSPRVQAPPVEPAAPEGPLNPLPASTAAAEKPLPPLKASDDAVREDLAAVLPPSAMERLMLEGFVHRVVATLDNLTREQYAQRLSPVVGVPGLPKVSGRDDTLAWSAENTTRYAPYIAALEAVDTNRMVDFYLRYYPLFQEAYVDLGYPKGYFNDRLVAVIDHLLGAPEVEAPIPLTQPKVLYEFANPELQQLSAGRKVLVRIGPANAAKVKAKLRAIRARVAAAR
jgi:hypothetical protein